MKTIVSISLGASEADYAFSTQFLGHKFRVKRLGADGSFRRATQMIREWRDKADVIGLGMVPDHHAVGTSYFVERSTRKLERAAQKRAKSQR